MPGAICADRSTFCAGSVAQRAPGVLQPVCSCVEVLGLSMDKEGTCRLLKLALKAAMTPHSWQASNMTLQAKGHPFGLLQQRRGTLTYDHRQCMHVKACSNAMKSGQAGSLCS
jgi:hypothetical protein